MKKKCFFLFSVKLETQSSPWDNLFFLSTMRRNPELPAQAGWRHFWRTFCLPKRLCIFIITSETKVILTPENLTNNTFKANTKVTVIKLFLFTKTKAGLETKQVKHRFSPRLRNMHMSTLQPAGAGWFPSRSLALPILLFSCCLSLAIIVRLRYQSSLTNSYRLYPVLSYCRFSSKQFWHSSVKEAVSPLRYNWQSRPRT